MIITFSGVDGCGKSTLISLLKDELSDCSNRTIILKRSRPSFLPILSSFVYGRVIAEKRAESKLPRKGDNNSRFFSYLRFFYYLTDYIFGGFLLKLKFPRHKYVLIYDRYYFDYIVDPKRFNLIINEKFIKFIYNLFIPKADVNIFILTNEDVVLSRKNELERDDIIYLNNSFSRLFLANGEKKGFYILDNTNLSLVIATEEIIKILRHDKKTFLLFNKA